MIKTGKGKGDKSTKGDKDTGKGKGKYNDDLDASGKYKPKYARSKSRDKVMATVNGRDEFVFHTQLKVDEADREITEIDAHRMFAQSEHGVGVSKTVIFGRVPQIVSR